MLHSSMLRILPFPSRCDKWIQQESTGRCAAGAKAGTISARAARVAGDDETIIGNSNLGERLGKLRKSESVYLHHGRRRTRVIERIVIGRTRECDIVVTDKLASRHHAEVQKIRNAYYITDCSSTNGVLVNGKRIEPGTYVRLRATDTITIGRTELRFVVG